VRAFLARVEWAQDRDSRLGSEERRLLHADIYVGVMKHLEAAEGVARLAGRLASDPALELGPVLARLELAAKAAALGLLGRGDHRLLGPLDRWWCAVQ
jgi:hypothetical protein